MRAVSVSIGLTLVLAAAGLPLNPLVPQVSASPAGDGLVISQVYGGGGLTVSDVSTGEGNAGTISFAFTVSLSAPAGAGGVTFDIATSDSTAIALDDYLSNALTGQTLPAGSSTYIVNVMVNGDVDFEPDESFFVNVSNVTGATVIDGQGVGTIVNDDLAPDPCTLPFTPIYTIQGSGPSAAITGTVTTEGVVVGDFEGTGAASGFYLQDATGDADPATSDGIFVFTGNSNLVSLGQAVRVTGFARERSNQTAINGSNSNTAPVPAANIVDCGVGTVSPVDVTMPFATATSPEAYEGMSVRFPQSLVIAEYFNYGRFGEIVLALPLAGEDRPYTPTSIDEPGAPALARAQANALSRITLDDANSVQNPPGLRHPNGLPFSLTNSFRGGDTVLNAVGVLAYNFSLYRIVPTGPAEYTAVNPRTTAPHDPGGAVRTAALNTLNFFITPDYAGGALDNKCGPSQSMECRGHDADQPDELGRQRTKLIQAIAGLDADVIGLNELENTLGVDPLGDPSGLVTGLNAQLGAGTYAYIDTGVIGTDAIRVGIIYRPAKVTPVGGFALLTSAVDPRFIDTRSRPALAQTFADNVTGERVTVAVNHLKSKGSGCADIGDPDAGDGQGNCNLTRRAAAEALVDWLASDPTGSGDDDFLILGDLNSYAMEDPIDAVRAGADDTAGTDDDFTNLINLYQGTYAYSYTFDGQAGYLDYAMSSADLTPQVTGAADWHINSDEPTVLDYDTSFKPPAQDALFEPNAYRSSDHDPVVVGLDLGAGTAKLSPDACSAGQQAIMVIGSSGDDEIFVSSVRGRVEVRFSGTLIGSFPVGGRILVLGQAGDDTITIDPRLTQQALVYGGDGDDQLSAGNGAAILVGGDGDDSLSSGNGRDVLIGGAGADQAVGGRGEDILIGGQTQFDHPLPANRQALCAALAQWADTTVGYTTRVAAMSGAFGTVVDAEIDGLVGGNGLDWFIVSTGDTTDRTGTEVATTV